MSREYELHDQRAKKKSQSQTPRCSKPQAISAWKLESENGQKQKLRNTAISLGATQYVFLKQMKDKNLRGLLIASASAQGSKRKIYPIVLVNFKRWYDS